ncbi:MAG: ABC transporter substrate-binding protein [Pseudonocardiales bacterium]|nr:ABC transporter substrate-binding protein [Pseudonocardiales bacterium]
MAGVALTAEQRIDAPPGAVFALFGGSTGAGWLFDASCERVAVGAAVTMQAPLGGEPVAVLGRISAVRPPDPARPGRIELRLDQPWRGRLRVLFEADGGGTRVRIVADLDDTGLAWLMRRRGLPVSERHHAGEHLLGLLTSKSGPGSVFAASTENLAAMAVDEVNADGGIRGRPLRLVVGDDGTDPATGAAEARRLVRAGCRTLLAATTSATFVHTATELRRSGVLLVQTLMNEGGLGGELCMQLGERPADQLRTAAGPLMAAASGRRWFLAGNDYVWPQVVHAIARPVLAEHRASIVGEAFAPLGTRDFSPLIERITASGADVVLSSFVGADLVAFERQCHAMGVRERCRTLTLALDEPTRERIGDAASAGMWGVSGYFEQLDGAANAAFLRRYRELYGRFAPPVSSIAESAYEAVHLYAGAARRAGEDEPRTIARELRSCRAEFARGPVAVTGPETVRQELFVAEAVAGGFAVGPSG